MRLGFCAEGCSSLLFPAVMGPSKANEMLLLGRRLTAQEAERVRVDAVLALLNDEVTAAAAAVVRHVRFLICLSSIIIVLFPCLLPYVFLFYLVRFRR